MIPDELRIGELWKISQLAKKMFPAQGPDSRNEWQAKRWAVLRLVRHAEKSSNVTLLFNISTGAKPYYLVAMAELERVYPQWFTTRLSIETRLEQHEEQLEKLERGFGNIVRAMQAGQTT